MIRDTFRGIIRIIVILCIMASCGETFYFMGELSKNSAEKRNYRYDSYAVRSSTMVNNTEETDDYLIDTIETNSSNDDYY